MSRTGELTGRHEHLYDMSPVHAASERNARINSRVERYMEESLENVEVPEPQRRAIGRQDYYAQKRERIAAPLVEDPAEGESNWKKQSKRLTGMFRRG
jgi:hypothetical protein